MTSARKNNITCGNKAALSYRISPHKYHLKKIRTQGVHILTTYVCPGFAMLSDFDKRLKLDTISARDRNKVYAYASRLRSLVGEW